MIFKSFKAIWHPERYHGWNKEKKFFEGWYFKILDKNMDHALAIIPGIAMDEQGSKQAFIQMLDGVEKTARYYKFDHREFIASKDSFEVSIENNHFSGQKLSLSLPELNGKLLFKDSVPWPKSFLSPGIMGPYSFVPFMECYHGVLSMNHYIEGSLNYKGNEINFNGGKGYLEKDWGHSFPEGYIWMQSNHFKNDKVSVKASVAKIPWLRNYFIGFIAGLWYEDEIIRFTTYNKSKRLKTTLDGKQINLVFENRDYRLELHAKHDQATSLASPINGFMDGRIAESMTSYIHLKLYNQKGDLLLDDRSENAAMEVAGITETLILDQ